ncbi:hypothetical protein RHMOL_Rhmol01G0207100 [Rhododendron molle]|uniref:Uncharacterized protein n=1 Tax=Rhododendron molle TaxID=49168 RepID=A0ACC0Q463_RHOML|nr:hypothetical protein RHMOL_Rhmol01G0207100 [Rhododendron molle]
MSMSTEEEFEVAWKNLLDDYGLHQNKWAVDVYKKKTLWAEAYLRGIFFAGAKSTQRVEGMNAYMNRFLKLRLKLFEFVQSFDRALAKLRHNEAKVQVESVNSTPVLSTCMKRIEKHAAGTYTRGIFNKFLKEIKKEQSLFKVDKVEFEDFRVYYLSRYQQPDATWSVNYQLNDGIMKCSCLKFESIGFPCQHMISVMKMEHMREIPSCLILQRWTKTAKSSPLHGSTPMPEWVTQTTRFGALSSACVEMCYYALHITKGYNETKEEITKLTSRMRELYVLNVEEEQRNMRQNDNVEGTSMHFGVGDPVTIKGTLYHYLDFGSTVGSKDMGGMFILLQVWGWERFPFLAPARNGKRVIRRDSPLSGRWDDEFHSPNLPTHVVGHYQFSLDVQRPDEVVWQPYTEDLIQSLPRFCSAGRGLWMASVPLIQFSHVEQHQPEQVLRQFGGRQTIPPPPPSKSLGEFHAMDLRNGPKDWSKPIRLWNNRANNIVNITDPDILVYPADDPYLDWYERITLRFVSKIGAATNIAMQLFERLSMSYLSAEAVQAMAQKGIECLKFQEKLFRKIAPEHKIRDPQVHEEFDEDYDHMDPHLQAEQGVHQQNQLLPQNQPLPQHQPQGPLEDT